MPTNKANNNANKKLVSQSHKYEWKPVSKGGAIRLEARLRDSNPEKTANTDIIQ